MYKLPNGKTTKNKNEYGLAWRSLMDRLQAVLPEGYFVDACDPGVRITLRRNNDNGTYTGLWSGDLTVDLAEHFAKLGRSK